MFNMICVRTIVAYTHASSQIFMGVYDTKYDVGTCYIDRSTRRGILFEERAGHQQERVRSRVIMLYVLVEGNIVDI